MKKILVLLIAILVILTGCDRKEKFYLDDKYYGDYKFIDVDNNKIDKLQKDKASYMVFTFNPYCQFQKPCDEVFEAFMKDYNISIYNIPFAEFKETELYKHVKYAPSVILINKGKVVAYLDANKDEDLDKYQEVKDFKEWVERYVYLEK